MANTNLNIFLFHRGDIDGIYRACLAMVEEESHQLGGGSSREVRVFDHEAQTADQLQQAASQFLKNPKVTNYTLSNMYLTLINIRVQ